MIKGGARPGAGRKPGQPNKKKAAEIARAARKGMLPHEFLAAVARGETIDGHTPTFDERVAAAAQAAPYFAAKMSTSNVSVRRITDIGQLSDDELAALAGGSGIEEAEGVEGVSAGLH
jgi:hypothetical protein